MKRLIRNIIIGRGVYVESRNEFRQIMLSGHYALLSLLVTAFYLCLDLPNGFHDSAAIFCIAFALIFYSLVLHRQKQSCKANFVLFPTLNILLFIMATSESKFTASFVFFIPISLGSFAVFNYAQRKI